MTAAVLAVVALATVTPGAWSGSTSDRADVTRARVTFDVMPGAGLIQPFVRVDLRGCRSTRTVHLRRSFGLVGAGRGRFAARVRYSPPGRAQNVRLRLVGRFRSDTLARGFVRGRIRFVGGHVCRIPRLSWVARPVGLAPDDGAVVVDEDLVDDEENFEDGEFEEDDEFDDEDPGDEDDIDEGDDGDDEP